MTDILRILLVKLFLLFSQKGFSVDLPWSTFESQIGHKLQRLVIFRFGKRSPPVISGGSSLKELDA